MICESKSAKAGLRRVGFYCSMQALRTLPLLPLPSLPLPLLLLGPLPLVLLLWEDPGPILRNSCLSTPGPVSLPCS